MHQKEIRPDWTKSVNVRLSNGEYLLWGEGTPEQFRKLISVKATIRLVRVAESVEIYNPTLEFVKVQKGDIASVLKGLPDGYDIACEFDGSTLLILGTVEA